MAENSTFCGGEPSWANACVGDNGQPDYFDYAQGFSAAANLLIKSVLENEGMDYPVDTFVYPICFNMRHSVELRLKGVVDAMRRLSDYRSLLPKIDLQGTHDIGKIWSYIKVNSVLLDSRFAVFGEVLQGYIADIAAIDPTGQTFRYPDSNENVRHLTDVAVINISVLSRRFVALEQLLDCFESFCDVIVTEYQWGTYTRVLSRAQFFDIALRIPHRNHWSETGFKLIVNDIKRDYAISQREFNKAVENIENHYGMSQNMTPPPLRALTSFDLDLFVAASLQVSEERKGQSSESVESLDFDNISMLGDAFESSKRVARKKSEVWEILRTEFGVEKVADLWALYDCALVDYSEEYVVRYENKLRYLKARYRDDVENCLRGEMFDILSKNQVVSRILKALFFVGHRHEAEVLITQYSLGGQLKWLEDARRGVAFVEPYRRALINLVGVLGELALRSTCEVGN